MERFGVRLWLFFLAAGLAVLGLVMTFGGTGAVQNDGPWLFLAGFLGMLGLAAWTVDLHTRPRQDDTDDSPTGHARGEGAGDATLPSCWRGWQRDEGDEPFDQWTPDLQERGHPLWRWAAVAFALSALVVPACGSFIFGGHSAVANVTAFSMPVFILLAAYAWCRSGEEDE